MMKFRLYWLRVRCVVMKFRLYWLHGNVLGVDPLLPCVCPVLVFAAIIASCFGCGIIASCFGCGVGIIVGT